MNQFKMACLVFCVFVMMVFSNTAFAAKKVVVISGISEANVKQVGYDLIYSGINEGFKPAGITPEYLWVDMDAIPEPAKKEAAGMATIAKAKAGNPDLIIVINDDCLRYVGMKIENTPVVFAYIFGDPTAFGLPKANVTGVTRRSYAGDIWAMANKLFGAKTVALLSKKTASMEGVRKYLLAGADKLEAASGVRYKEMYLLDTFEEWEKTVKAFPESFIYLADTSRIAKGDKELTRAEITAWTVANSKVPVVGATEGDVGAGALYAIVTSEKAIGVTAAEVSQKVLSGTSPADIPYVQSQKGKLVINTKTAQQYKITIPYEILSTAEKLFE